MRTLTPVLCTSGLAAEAKVARAAGFQVIVGAGDPRRTAELVELAAKRAKFLVSFGVAGGLAPHLRLGTGDPVGRGHRRRPALASQSAVSSRKSASWPAASARSKARCSVPATSSPPRKTRFALGASTGALAVDLESAIVARTAEAAGMPFLVLRTIADPATRELPPAALIPLWKNGTPALHRVFSEVLRRPRQIGALFGLARETRQA